MGRWATALLAAGFAGAGFGWWGLFTPSGRRSFDEMDGIIPAASGLLGAGLIVVGIVLALFVVARGRQDP
jgi:hypothetical protein